MTDTEARALRAIAEELRTANLLTFYVAAERRGAVDSAFDRLHATLVGRLGLGDSDD